jgi:hypothetical protein
VTDEKEITLSADRLWAGIAFLMTAITAALGHLFKRHIKRIDDQAARIEDLEKAMLKKIDHDDVAEMLDSIRKETTQRFDQILLALGKK